MSRVVTVTGGRPGVVRPAPDHAIQLLSGVFQGLLPCLVGACARFHATRNHVLFPRSFAGEGGEVLDPGLRDELGRHGAPSGRRGGGRLNLSIADAHATQHHRPIPDRIVRGFHLKGERDTHFAVIHAARGCLNRASLAQAGRLQLQPPLERCGDVTITVLLEEDDLGRFIGSYPANRLGHSHTEGSGGGRLGGIEVRFEFPLDRLGPDGRVRRRGRRVRDVGDVLSISS